MGIFPKNLFFALVSFCFCCNKVFGFLIHRQTTTTSVYNLTTEILKLEKNVESPSGGDHETSPVERETGSIVGAVFGVLVCVVFISTIGIISIRRKRQRDRENTRQMTVMRSSRESSGVYMDTCTGMAYRTRDSRGGSKYSSVPGGHAADDDDSEDELWSASTR